MCNKIRYFLVFLFILVFGGTFSFGSVFYISHNGIADHGDVSVYHSVAWYLQTYGEGNTYVLTTSNVYYNIGSTLAVPANSILRGNSNWLIKMAATASLDNKTMITMSDGSQLYNLYINGVRHPSCLVQVPGRSSVMIDRCTIFDSKNNYTSGNPYTMLIFCADSSDVTVQNCVLRRAGCNPKVNPDLWEGLGYGILSRGCRNMIFSDNDIGQTLTGGIDITGSASVLISGNYISDTGQNREYDGPISDGITGYHNLIDADEDFTITGNTILNSQNHGIHVSGRWIDIRDNVVSGQQLSGIMVDDWRSPNEFSENVIVSNNLCGDPLSWIRAPGNSNRKIYVDRVNTNSGFILEYQVNKDLNGSVLPLTVDNYKFPSIFGPHGLTRQELYQEWASGYGLSGGAESLMADPDSDGMCNLIEYGLGGNPSLDDSQDVLPKFQVDTVDGVVRGVYIYRRRRDAGSCGLSYFIESNTNLICGCWDVATVNTNNEPVYVDDDFEQVTNTVSTGGDVLFVRLKIEAGL